MDSRNILSETEKIEALIDSNSFHSLVVGGNRVASAILGFNDSRLVDFVRTPLATNLPELQAVPEYTFELDASSWIKCLSISVAYGTKRTFFGYRWEDIAAITQAIFGKAVISEQEFERVLLVFVQATLSMVNINKKTVNIFVTNESTLLKKRLWFESHFPGGTLNIMSVEEAGVFIDLFLKKQGKYRVSAFASLNKGYWYLLSMRLKLPHYNVGDQMLEALSQRFEFILMALDEMGIQFYSGTNNDTMDNTLYHFNYLITLMTGIFDNLALKTNSQLGINYADLRRVCINNNAGKEFLREIRERNQPIRDHIASYMGFINLIYEFRELVVHREGLVNTGFENRGDVRWRANFIRINMEIHDRLRTCGDTPSQFDPFTEWGFYQMGGFLLLDPYHFAFEATMKLTTFVDKYLELLGYPSFIASARNRRDNFADTLNGFERGHLGF